ncbi:hypothetical protein ACCAA_850004 [Candidatus Accumulibacter aalborgensis]|uniref:Uncharacterized protein n=1 Tax=Candidatus Accumulibacter aalborgensis TaxID=1860102 RepID=A0A1A8XYP8_9PROT|nr:hypothetical protein ACCAA_850004 [Candidatus Accumulibacter aalborgensis]
MIASRPKQCATFRWRRPSAGSILDFHADDFVQRPASSLAKYANRHAPEQAPLGFRVRHTPYDPTIANGRRPPPREPTRMFAPKISRSPTAPRES